MLTKLINKNEVIENSPKLVVIGEKKIAIYLIEGKFYATSAVCSHMSGPLDKGHLEDKYTIVCPNHGARFDIRTGKSPENTPIKAYDVFMKDDDLYIELDESQENKDECECEDCKCKDEEKTK